MSRDAAVGLVPEVCRGCLMRSCDHDRAKVLACEATLRRVSSERAGRPAYNHSREDSPLRPCALCAKTPAERELAEALAAERWRAERAEAECLASLDREETQRRVAAKARAEALAAVDAAAEVPGLRHREEHARHCLDACKASLAAVTERAERAEARLAPLERVAEAARGADLGCPCLCCDQLEQALDALAAAERG